MENQNQELGPSELAELAQQILGDKHLGLLTLGWGGEAEEIVKGRMNFWSVFLCNLNTSMCLALLMLFYRKHFGPFYKLQEGCLSVTNVTK